MLLAWWLLVSGAYSQPQMVGPMPTWEKCVAVRDAIVAHGTKILVDCWHVY